MTDYAAIGAEMFRKHGAEVIPMIPRRREAWSAAEEEAVEIVKHPEPEVRARPAEVEEIPTGARRLLVAARKASSKAWLLGDGWFTWATYARGTTPGGRVVDSVLVKGIALTRGRFVASYEDGKARTAYWSPDLATPPERILFTDLRRRILGEEV